MRVQLDAPSPKANSTTFQGYGLYVDHCSSYLSWTLVPHTNPHLLELH